MTWATSVPVLVFRSLSVLELGPMYATRQTDRRQTKASLNASALWGGGIKTVKPMHGRIVVTGEQTNKQTSNSSTTVILQCLGRHRTAASERLDNITRQE